MDAASTPSLRLLTQNVWAHGGDWPARRAALRDGIQALAPDLVSLQETVVDGESDQARDLLGDGFDIVHAPIRSNDGVGLSIASRWPVVDRHDVDLRLHVHPVNETAPCALIIEVEVPGLGRVVLVNHSRSWRPRAEAERERQAVMLARELERFGVAGEVRDAGSARWPHLVIAGDHDADPSAASIRFWTGRQSLDGLSVAYRDAWEAAHGTAAEDSGATFTPANPLMADADWPYRRIDHILVRCADHGGPTLGIASCERAFDQPVDGTWASDHFGLVADLALPPR